MAKPVTLQLARIEKSAPVALPADAARVLEIAAARARAGISGAMATVIARHGSAPSTPGQKIERGAGGTCAGTVGGGAVEREVMVALGAMASGGRHHVRSFKLGAELGMCCGGGVEVLLEPIEELCPCLVVGGGHVGT